MTVFEHEGEGLREEAVGILLIMVHLHLRDLATDTPPAPSFPWMVTSSTRNVMYFLPPIMIPPDCRAVGLLKPLTIIRASPSVNYRNMNFD